jgi:protein-S-isoprenylcysteine O-methyltransferase Ste14
MLRRLLPPFWLVLTIALMVVTHFLAPIQTIVPFPWGLAGAVLGLAGFVLAVRAERRFKAAGTEVKPYRESQVLVTDGAFRRTRNPMYLGMFALLAGLAVCLGSVGPWALVLGFFLLIRVGYVPVEKRMMASTFGEAYLDYRSRVRRWL